MIPDFSLSLPSEHPLDFSQSGVFLQGQDLHSGSGTPSLLANLELLIRNHRKSSLMRNEEDLMTPCRRLQLAGKGGSKVGPKASIHFIQKKGSGIGTR